MGSETFPSVAGDAQRCCSSEPFAPALALPTLLLLLQVPVHKDSLGGS